MSDGQDVKAVEAGDAGGVQMDAKAIFDAEVAALTKGESSRKATVGGVVDNNGLPYQAEEPVNQEESAAPEDGDEGKGEEGESKKQRRDWKKEAIESQKVIDEFKAKFEALEAKISNPGPVSDKGVSVKKPGVPAKLDFTKMELTQEVKDFIEFTPGFDTMLAQVVAEQARLLIENTEAERQVKQTQEKVSQESSAKETKFWTDLDNWVSTEYPELKLSEIRNSPDFNDWLEYRKNWVDTQLKGAGRYETSGAQKVYERYIEENGLAQKKQGGEGDQNARRLASARTPVVGRRTPSSQKSSGNLFNDEVSRLKGAAQYRNQVI